LVWRPFLIPILFHAVIEMVLFHFRKTLQQPTCSFSGAARGRTQQGERSIGRGKEKLEDAASALKLMQTAQDDEKNLDAKHREEEKQKELEMKRLEAEKIQLELEAKRQEQEKLKELEMKRLEAERN